MNKFERLMQATTVKYTQSSPIAGELQVKIAGDCIVDRMELAYAELKHDAAIKGFRKGKVPLGIIKQYYKNQVIRDTFERIVSETCRGAAVQEKIPLIGEPRVHRTNWLTWKEGEDMEYTALVELIPDPELKKYKGLSITVDDFSVTEEKVKKSLEQILESHAELKSVETSRGVRDDDIVVIDFAGRLEDRELPDASAKNFLLEMQGSHTIPEFQEGLLGMKSGEMKDIVVTYPADYTNKEIAGKKVTYAVTLHEIKMKSYPELTDELAKEFKLDSAAALQAKVRENLEYQSRHDEKIHKEEKLLQALVEANPMPVPASLVQYQLNHIVRELSQMLEHQKFSAKLIEEYISRHIDELHNRAEREVKLALLLPKIVLAEKILPKDADLDKRLEQMAQTSGKDLAQMRKAYEKDEARHNLLDQIARDQAIDLIVEHAKITVKKRGA